MRILIVAAALAAASPAAAFSAQAPRPGEAATPSTPAPASPTAAQPTPEAPRSLADKITPGAERCSWLIRTNGKLEKNDAPDLDLIRTTAALTPPAGPGKLEGVYCERDSMAPGEHDDRVPLQLGVPLFLNGPTGMTTVSLKDGRFNIAYSKGATLSETLQQAVRNVVLRWEYRAANQTPR